VSSFLLRIDRLALLFTSAALAVASYAPSAEAQGLPTSGPDVTVIDIYDIDSYGGGGGFHGYAVGTTSCNIGDDELNWCNTTGCGGGLSSKQHPVIAQNLYRLKAGRFEQIGMSWLKHGFFATNKGNAQICKVGTSCITPPLGFEQLGIGCTDTYWAGLNGDQPLGRRSEVNATTSDFNFPYTNLPFSRVYDQRVKVADCRRQPRLKTLAPSTGPKRSMFRTTTRPPETASTTPPTARSRSSPKTFALTLEPDNLRLIFRDRPRAFGNPRLAGDRPGGRTALCRHSGSYRRAFRSGAARSPRSTSTPGTTSMPFAT
jgi:hypothetical protein